MKNELQNTDIFLKGDLGVVTDMFTLTTQKITKVEKRSDGATTITLGGTVQKQLGVETEDAEFEIIEPKQIENGKH